MKDVPYVPTQCAATHHKGGKDGPHCAAANTAELECRWDICRVTKEANIEQLYVNDKWRRVIRASVLSQYFIKIVKQAFIQPVLTELNYPGLATANEHPYFTWSLN